MTSEKMQMTSNPQRREQVKFLFCLVIIGVFWVLPPLDPLTASGMRAIGVFFALIVGWTITNSVWPSLVGFLAFPLTGIMPMSEFLAVGWGSQTVVFLVFAFGLIQYLTVTGLSQHIANWLMSRPFVAGHPWRLIFMLLFMSFILDCFVKTIVGILLAWELIYQVSDACGFKPKDPFPTIMLIGVTIIGSISLVTMPWSMNAVVDFNVYVTALGESVNVGKYLSLSVTFGLLSILVYMVLCQFVFRLDVTPIREMDADFLTKLDLTMTPEKRLAAGALLAFVVLLLTPSFLPADMGLAKVFGQIGIVGAVTLIFLVLSLVKQPKKEPFVFAKMLATGIPWNIIIMLSVILCVGPILMNPATGIKAFLDAYLVPVFSSFSPLMFIVVTSVISIVLTNLVMNMIVVSLLIPVIVPLAPLVGLSPEEIGYLIIVTSTIALLTPASSAASSLLFPNTAWINKKDIYAYGIPAVLGMTLLFFAVYLPWRFLIF